MDYADYVRQISFRLVRPETPRPSGFRALNLLARKAGIHLEMWMTALPEGQADMQHRLRRVCRMRRHSTFAIGAMINVGVEQLSRGQACLCLGVGGGFSLFSAMAGHRDRICIGVDPLATGEKRREAFLRRFDRWKSPRHEFYPQGFCEYLSNHHRGAIGFVVADRLICGEQRDALGLVEPFLADGAHLLIQDSNVRDVRQKVEQFLAASRFEYQVILDVATPAKGHPTFWNGVILLARRGRKTQVASFSTRDRRAA